MKRDGTELETRVQEGLSHLAAGASVSPDASEQIEARWRAAQRPARPSPKTASRRRVALLPALGMAVLLIAVVLLVGGSKTPPSKPLVTVPSTRPGVVAAEAGGVAYVSAGRLLLSDGGHTVVVPMPAAGRATVSSPRWSSDAAYLSYVAQLPGTSGNELHMVSADGSSDRVVVRGRIFATGWSGSGHLLAASLAPGAGTGGLVVFTPGAAPRQVVPANTLVFSFIWATRGTSLAYSVARGGQLSDEVRTLDLATGADTRVGFGPSGAGVLVAGWWPGDDGLLWWIDPDHSVSLEADGLKLQSVPLGGGRPVDLLSTAVYLPWVTWSPDGATLAVVTGGDRLPWNAKRVALCHPRQGTCTVLASPAGTVSFGPAWSPDGGRLAFVRAAAAQTAEAGASFLSWYPSRRLWTAAADGTGEAVVAGAGTGVADVSWASLDLVRYSTADGIGVISVTSGSSATVATRLSGGSEGAGPDAYGKTPWVGVASWRP